MSNTTPTSAPTGQNANQRVAPLLAEIDLRDYFAAKALQGLLSDSNVRASEKEFATKSYAIADAMLKARSAE